MNTRVVLLLYAGAAIIGGLNITGTGIRGLPETTQPHASLIWIAGMILVRPWAEAGTPPQGQPLSSYDEHIRRVARREERMRLARDLHAAALDVSEETVKTHVANVLAKLKVENRAQAAVQARKRGLVTLEDLA
jgi:hypothetical protein